MGFITISLKNDLNISVNVFKSSDDANAGLPNYMGRLSFIGNIKASETMDIKRVAEPNSVYICYDEQNKPVKRIVVSENSDQEVFTITGADVAIISSTYSFFEFIKNNPNDPLSRDFEKLINGGKATPDSIDAFFKDSENYQTCTYASYILVLSDLSFYSTTNKNNSPAGLPYSLKSLISYMGVSWPSLLPDIPVTNFTCTTLAGEGNLISLGCDVDMQDINFGSEISKNIFTITPFNSFKVVHVFIYFNYSISTDLITVVLQFGLDCIEIPVSSDANIMIKDPAILFSFAPASANVTFEARATIPFKLFENPTFNADISMVISEEEAEIGAVISGDNSVLLTPPVIQGVHFTSFGVGMGVFFQPVIGYALGVQGSFTIGHSTDKVHVEDDTFAVVCTLREGIPTPIFISFYAAQISLNELVTIFTDTDLNINFPVSVKQLSFVWQENPAQPVTLPDGSIVQYTFGFSGFLDFFGLGFYGDVTIDPITGVNGIITMSPYSLGPLSLKGKGEEISIKVDEAGNPIKNNYVPTATKEELAIQNAQKQVLIKAGGPVMRMNTFSSPYFLVSIAVEFLDCKESVEASVTNNGISYELDFEDLLTSKMSCAIQNYQNFYGSFTYGADFMVPIPGTDNGFNLGSIHFKSTVTGKLKIAISTEVTSFTFSGDFDFCGYHSTIGPIALDVNIKSLQDILTIVEQWIIDNAASLFGSLYADAEAWINAINKAVVLLAANTAMYVIEGFSLAYNQSIETLGDLLKGTTYLLDDVAKGLNDIYKATSTAAANTMVTAYNASQNSVASSLKAAGYTADETAKALINVFDASMESVAATLLAVGYPVDVVAQALVDVFNASQTEVAAVLTDLGYILDDAGNWIIDTSKDAADDIKNTADDTAKQAADGAKDATDAGIKATTDAAKDAEDAAKDAADEAAKAAKDAADAAKDAADAASKEAKNAADDALKAAADALNPFNKK